MDGLMAFILGVACIGGGIFTLYKREGYVKVQTTELSEIYGAHETPTWKSYFRITIMVSGIVSIGLGLTLLAEAFGLINFWGNS